MDLTDPMFSTFRFRVWCSTCGVSVGTDDVDSWEMRAMISELIEEAQTS